MTVNYSIYDNFSVTWADIIYAIQNKKIIYFSKVKLISNGGFTLKTKLVDEKSISYIIQEMTVVEKIRLLTGSTTFRGGENKNHAIPGPLFLDGGTGFNTAQMRLETFFAANGEYIGGYDSESIKEPLEAFGISTAIASRLAKQELPDPKLDYIRERSSAMMAEVRPEDGNLGCFPPGILLGATMNPAVIEKCGEALGREASACKIDVLLGTPNVNLLRDPRNGRLFEGYSEDPCVVKKLAPSFVKGVQSTGVVANVKHFAANNQETDRMGVNEIIDERVLREMYLPGFKACIDAGCKTIMSAYNKINDKPCAQNEWLLKKVLRDEWKFDGFVMSDWGAVYDRVEGIKAGNDVTMPGPREIGSVLKAIEDGDITEKEIDNACQNYLKVLLEMPCKMGRKYRKIDIDFSMKAAYDAACEGITLLKNNGVLPLSKKDGIALYGSKCKKFIESGTGSAAVVTNLGTNLYDSARILLGKDKVEYETISKTTRAVIVTIGTTTGEGADRRNLDIDAEDKIILRKAIDASKNHNLPVILVLNIPGPVELMEFIDEIDAVLCVFYPGMAGGNAAIDILMGKINPSGKLPLSFPKYYRDTPTFLNFPGEYQKVVYGEGLFIGYRYYEIKEMDVLYPFGYGLSYTSFRLSNLSIPNTIDIETSDICVSFDIMNTGLMAGSEVIQIYVSDIESTLLRPKKELKSFKKIFLEAGETKNIQLKISSDDLACYDTCLGKFITEPGKFEILIGTSSKDIYLKGIVTVDCPNPYRITEKTEISKFITDQTAINIMMKYFPEIDFYSIAGVYIVFLPFMPFEEVWKRCIINELRNLKVESFESKYLHMLEELNGK